MIPSERVLDPKQWPVRVYRLGEEPTDDLSATTTADERLAMVALLTHRLGEYRASGAGTAGRRVVREGGVPADPRELIEALIACQARFLVIGAHALAVHGVPRATQDLDLWIDAAPENAARVWEALRRFGVPLHELHLSVADLSAPQVVVQLGVAPQRVDILTSISGVDNFSEAWATRVEHHLGGCLVPIIGRTALIANKRASGRLKDLADLEALGEGPGEAPIPR